MGFPGFVFIDEIFFTKEVTQNQEAGVKTHGPEISGQAVRL
jgi:hypothetical protein